MQIILLMACLNLDLVVLADFSGSVGGNEKFICEGISEISKIYDDDLRQALITFDYDPKVVYGFGDKRDFACRGASGGTNLYAALSVAAQLFDRDSGRVIVIICDGEPYDKEMTLELANLLKNSGIKIFGVLINSSVSSESFMKQISDVYVSTDYEHLVEEIKKLNFCL